MDAYSHKIHSSNGYDLRVQIWDTSGEKKFLKIVESYFDGSSFIVILFDCSKKAQEILESLDYWYQIVKNHFEEKKIPPLLLLGHKSDLLPLNKEKEKIEENIENWRKKNKMKFFYFSSKNGFFFF